MPTVKTKRLTRAQKRAANRGRLLEAAVRVFSERGYDGATVEAIAEESGLSNGALYYNFASKQDLFLALLDQRMERRIGDLERIFQPAPTDPTEEQVQTATLNVARDFPDPREWALFFEFVTHSGRDARFRREFRKRLRRMRGVLALIVERRTAELETRLSLPPEQVAIAIQALGYGLHAQRVADPAAIGEDLQGRILLALLSGLAEESVPG
jgi:AcrR family transcriptional regulator